MDKTELLNALLGKEQVKPLPQYFGPMTAAYRYGGINIRSGVMHLGDPCYNYVSASVPVRAGQWVVYGIETNMPDWGTRIAFLVALHESVKRPLSGLNWSKWKGQGKVPLVLNVDSGQMGMFSKFPVSGQHDAFYESCCNATNDRDRMGGAVAGCGVVCSSGVGDGTYHFKVAKDGGIKVHAVMVDFGLAIMPKMRKGEASRPVSQAIAENEFESALDQLSASDLPGPVMEE